MIKVLVVGGAGYIGSHMMTCLSNAGLEAVAFDNLSSGYKDAVKYGRLVEGDLKNSDAILELLESENFDGVMHFASSIEVAESQVDPKKYYVNNLKNSLNLINAMLESETDNLIFSSTAAVFGDVKTNPIKEEFDKNPVNVYGRTKLFIESILDDYREAYGFSSTTLRYFNAAGADPSDGLGERHDPETHLIPLTIQAAMGRRPDIKIFGTDFETPDGTCIRDYVHVVDLCAAHLTALTKLMDGDKGRAYNLGNGHGFSVRQVVESVGRVTGLNFPIVETSRRSGDPDVLVADSTLARKDLEWSPKFCEIDEIVFTAWEFARKYGG